VVRVLVLAAFPASALLLLAQSLPLPDILLFARARTKMQAHLKGQPNYVCLETIERSQRDPRKKRSSLLDVLRLEVAIVGHKELYAWPGSNHFEETELVDMVPPGGTIGSGAFALHAWNLFFSGGPRTLPGEWTESDGRRLARFPYEVSELASGYQLRVARTNWAIVGYHGSIWIDAESEEVTRIEVIADRIPLQLGLDLARTVIDYGDVEIGGQPYRLPMRTLETVLAFNGQENRNEGRFTACRQFVGESKLSFGDPPPAEEKAARTVTEVNLPEGLTVYLELATPIDSGRSKTGDFIEAVLAAPIKQKKQILFEKGSRVDGRLVRLQMAGGRVDAELQFFSISNADRHATFNALPQVPLPPSFSAGSVVRQNPVTPVYATEPGHPGLLHVSVEGARLALLRGSRSTWVTTPAPAPAPSGKEVQ
jgi:hypothetical protein